MKRMILSASLLLLSAGLVFSQTTPPEYINYQGVLRDTSDHPLNGSYNMVFRFYDAESGGNLLLTDSHTGVDAVTVSGGLFNALLGDSTLTPGTYSSLSEVFANEGDVYLEVQVGAETLAPRIRMASAGYALNAANLDGRPASEFLDISSTTQTKAGDLALNDLTVNGNDILFGGGSKIISGAGNLQLRNDGDTDDLFLLAGNSWDDGRIILFGGDRMEFRAGNGKFNFFNGANSDPIAELLADGSLSLDGRLTVGNVAVAVSDGPLDLYVDGTNGDDLNDGLSPDTAKQTIQAAVDAIPLVLTGPATVHIADGTYHEAVIIDRRIAWSLSAWLTLVGNEASPQNVLLDGQGAIDETGIVVLGIAEIRGVEITGFQEEGLEVDFGFMFVDNCRIIGNGTGTGYDGIGVFGARADISNTVIANNGDSGIEVEDGASNVHLSNVEITGNANHGIEVDDSSHVHLGGGGTLLIQSNGGIGVRVQNGSSVDFNGEAGLTIQSNTGGSMQVSYHSTVRGYGNGTVGSCVEADSHSMCAP